VHVLVVLQHYHTPDCDTAARPWALVRALASEHRVTVLTTDAGRRKRITHDFDWVPDGARLETVRVPYANEMATPERLRAFLAYAAKALWTGLRGPRPDLVYASSTPLTVGAVGAALAARWRCPWVFEVQDLWPDFPIQMGALEAAGPARPLLRRALYGLEHFLYRSADRVVTVSPDMAAHVRQFTEARKVFSVEYGTDLDLLPQADVTQADGGTRATPSEPLRERLPVSEHTKIVLYAGNFGRANDLRTLVEAARRTPSRPRDVHFVFAGSGYHRPLLSRAARRLPGVSLLDPLPYPKTLALFEQVDLSLVSFLDRPVLSANAPSKFFDSLAAGTPVVVTNPGWTKHFVEQHRCGWYVPAEAPGALTHRLETLVHDDEQRCQAARNARRAARAHFDRAAHMNELLSIIEDVAR